jgi:hypothetical protein
MMMSSQPAPGAIAMPQVLLTVLLIIAAGTVRAQEAIATVPDAYSPVFENEWVKVTRVHYAPHAKLPAHAHTAWASAYVYLNDSGPVAFKHIGAEYGAATRPPTRARSFRLYRGIREIHEVENLSPLASDFMRVEFKTDPGDPRTLRGTFYADSPSGGQETREQFVNEQLRVTRIVLPPGAHLDLSLEAAPSLLVYVSPQEAGTVRWLPKGGRERLSHAGGGGVELLRFELRTPPIASR